MAKIKVPGNEGQLSGKLGKNVYGHNRHGDYVREYVKSDKPPTDSMAEKNQEFEKISPVWESLEDNERIPWLTYGSDRSIASMLGNKKIKTGWNLYHSINLRRLYINETVLRKFPQFKYPQQIDKFNVKITEKRKKKDIIFEISPEIRDDTKIVIMATEGLSNGKTFINDNLYKIIKIADHKFRSGNSIKADYMKVFGIMPEHMKKVSFKVKAVHRECGVTGFPQKITFTYKEQIDKR
jgi:hypothetical protein